MALVAPVILVQLPGFLACYGELILTQAGLLQKHLAARVADKLHDDGHFGIISNQ